MKLGTLFSMRYRVLKAIPVDIRVSDGVVFAEWDEVGEWGEGHNVSEALCDLAMSVKELHHELKDRRLGRDLEHVMAVMEDHFVLVR